MTFFCILTLAQSKYAILKHAIRKNQEFSGKFFVSCLRFEIHI